MGFVSVFAACVLGLVSARAEDSPALSRPTEPLPIADFEAAQSVAEWSGLTCTQTHDHASSGAAGMQFTIPKWTKGEEPRPGVRLLYDGGRGFPLRDWSGYGAIAVDAWVLGDQPGHLGLKVLDGKGISSWTTHITVKPGMLNEATLSIDDAAADCDVHDVREVVLYALRSETRFTLAVDNLRLLPRDKPPLARFQLLYPNYRKLIFPGAGPVEVAAQIEASDHGLKLGNLSVVLSLQAGSRHLSAKHPLKRFYERVSISGERLPVGPATLTVSLVKKGSRGALAQQSWDLRNMGPDEAATLKTYVGRDNNLVVDGKPFFPLGWYTNCNSQYLDEVATGPFNCLLPYGTNHVPRSTMLQYLDAVQAHGLKLIYCMNDVYPTSTLFDGKNWEGIEGNDAIAAAVVKAYKSRPAILAWYLNDERPRELAPQLEDYYNRVKNGDPEHPCFIVLCNKKDFRYLQHTTDIMGGDTYPIPEDPVTFVSAMTDVAREACNEAKPVWMVLQAFGWYQYDSDNKDRGHQPTPEELQTGRAPTYEEARCMTYLALTHGAKGLIYYCYYDLRLLPQYDEMWGWMKSIGNEVKTLTPLLLSNDDRGAAPYRPASAPIHTKLKAQGGRLYLMAVNAGGEACQVTFDTGQKLPPRVDVLFENRQASTTGQGLTVDFQPLEVHVFDLGPVGKEGGRGKSR